MSPVLAKDAVDAVRNNRDKGHSCFLANTFMHQELLLRTSPQRR